MKPFFDFLKSWWFLIVPAIGVVGIIRSVPVHGEQIKKLESRQETTERYIQAIEEEKQLRKKAPPGWKWNELTGKYEPDPTWKGAAR